MRHKLMTRQERDDFVEGTRNIEIPFFGVEGDSESGSDDTKYPRLTERQYRAFMDAYRGEGGDSTQIGFGFRVVGNLLKHASVAYTEFLSESGEEPNIDELREVLLSSFDDIVVPVASLDIDRAVPYETWLGLRDGRDGLYTPSSYSFNRRQDGLVILPKADNLDYIDKEIAELDRSPDHKIGPNRGCPALAFVLPVLWETDVKGCVSDQDYFAADIESALEAAKVEA